MISERTLFNDNQVLSMLYLNNIKPVFCEKAKGFYLLRSDSEFASNIDPNSYKRNYLKLYDKDEYENYREIICNCFKLKELHNEMLVAIKKEDFKLARKIINEREKLCRSMGTSNKETWIGKKRNAILFGIHFPCLFRIYVRLFLK